MDETLSAGERAKWVAAKAASAMVEDGMRVGLGTGSTAAWLVRHLGERVRAEGLEITTVATSERTADLAREQGLAVVGLEDAGWLDLTVDGADEVDGAMTLLKGGGGALLREKIVAAASDRMVVIADASKHVSTLGRFPLPVEVVRFGWTATRTLIEETLAPLDLARRGVALRQVDGAPYVTDCGNHILDLDLGRIGKPRELARLLTQIPGVVETGLFIDLCDAVITGHADGRVEIADRAEGTTREDWIEAGGRDNIFADLGE